MYEMVTRVNVTLFIIFIRGNNVRVMGTTHVADISVKLFFSPLKISSIRTFIVKMNTIRISHIRNTQINQFYSASSLIIFGFEISFQPSAFFHSTTTWCQTVSLSYVSNDDTKYFALKITMFFFSHSQQQ